MTEHIRRILDIVAGVVIGECVVLALQMAIYNHRITGSWISFLRNLL